MEGGKTTSLWGATTEFITTSPLTKDLETEVIVVGGGLGGITTAYLLAVEGKRVVVIDDGPIGGGETGRTTAHLTDAIDDRFYYLRSTFGKTATKLAADSQTQAINQIESIVRKLNIDCDFERLDGYLFIEPGADDAELKKELEACREAGMAHVDLVESVPLPNFRAGKALRFRNQAQFHPLKYLNALVAEFKKLGGELYTGTHVQSVAPQAEAVKTNGSSNGSAKQATPARREFGKPVELKTDEGFTIRAKHAVFATNTPTNDWVVMHTKQAPYRTYVVGYEVPKGTFSHALLWDPLDPYHYIRIHPMGDKDVVIVGGEDHKTGQSDRATGDASPERWAALEKFAKEHMPLEGSPRYKWSGQVMEPIDGLAFLGRNPMDETDTYIITGDSGMGMTNTTAGAMIIRDLIMGRDNPWADLYDPGRITLRAAGEWLRENANVAGEYAQWLSGGDQESAGNLQPGEGALISHGTSKTAVYRDEQGTLHELSARCTHLSCLVHWNKVEKTWDCPCHGSRFKATGEVLNGPAVAPLEPIAHRHGE
jgi:glycine/D-amino acid oxidase-like deaminating enzyme/nitrite reductase/ring-hydroxylating ferredoxin subunit